MPWREHLDQDEKNVIARDHGSERFKKVATKGLMFIGYRAVKSRVHPQHHAALDRVWFQTSYPADGPLAKQRENVEDRIADIIDQLDQQTGGHGARGAAWLDAKAREIQHYVQSQFERHRS